jgi:RNA polymerase primary sigma factor
LSVAATRFEGVGKGRTAMTQEHARRQTERALAALAHDIGPHLRDSSVPRSVLERFLAKSGADQDLRDAAMYALDAARIRVVEDGAAVGAVAPGSKQSTTVRSSLATTSPPGPGQRSGRPSTRTPRAPQQEKQVDPTEIARRRLAADRRMSPSRLPKVLLTAEEEVGLTLLARPGGKPLEPGGLALLVGEARDAAEALVLHNLRLARSVARGYVGQGLEYDDLYQSAAAGLLRAVELFDPMSGFKFSTYATWWLRQGVTRAIANESRCIRLPVHMWESVRKVGATRERLTVDGQPPGLRELADACGLDVAGVIECLRLAPGVLSLETPLGDDQFTLGDLIDAQSDLPEHVEVHGLFPDDVERLLQGLKEREADVLRRRFGLSPHDEKQMLEDIGQLYGVTRERIRQIEAKALERLRHTLAEEGHTFGDAEEEVDAPDSQASAPGTVGPEDLARSA